jgi:hypothetical protein
MRGFRVVENPQTAKLRHYPFFALADCTLSESGFFPFATIPTANYEERLFVVVGSGRDVVLCLPTITVCLRRAGSPMLPYVGSATDPHGRTVPKW